MSRKEVPRPGLVRLAVAGQITNPQGAQGAHLSVRQFQRVNARVSAEGIHGSAIAGEASRPPAPCRALRTRVAALLHSVYRDVNDCHATEKLREVHGIAISRASVRRLRRALGLPAKHGAAPGTTAPPAPRVAHGRPRPARRQSVRLAGNARPDDDPARRHR